MPRITISSQVPTPEIFSYGQMISMPGVYRLKGDTDNTRFITIEKSVDGQYQSFYTDPDEDVFEILNVLVWKDNNNKFEKLNEVVTVHFT